VAVVMKVGMGPMKLLFCMFLHRQRRGRTRRRTYTSLFCVRYWLSDL